MLQVVAPISVGEIPTGVVARHRGRGRGRKRRGRGEDKAKEAVTTMLSQDVEHATGDNYKNMLVCISYI